MSQKNNPETRTIGARFRSARSLVPHLNRKSFCERHSINRYTMQSWENGLHISKSKNVEKFIEALAREGIYCTAEWLFEGTGDPARPMHTSSEKLEPKITKTGYENNHFELAHKLLDYLETKKLEPIMCLIKDDSMAPKYEINHIVIGIKSMQNLNIIDQNICIVALNSKNLLVRQVLILENNLVLLAQNKNFPIMTLSAQIPIYPIVAHFSEFSLKATCQN